ncbi:hypothetical protein ACWDUM_04395 [Rhodococcus sp. NPDC003322]
MNRHRTRAARQDGAAIRYLAQWRQRVESVERSVERGPRRGPVIDNAIAARTVISGELTDCPACDARLLGDGPRDRLESLMRRDGRRAHRLRAAVTRLDERYRDATVEVEAPATLPWWDRRVPWA